MNILQHSFSYLPLHQLKKVCHYQSYARRLNLFIKSRENGTIMGDIKPT